MDGSKNISFFYSVPAKNNRIKNKKKEFCRSHRHHRTAVPSAGTKKLVMNDINICMIITFTAHPGIIIAE